MDRNGLRGPSAAPAIRVARAGDLDAIVDIETSVFDGDQLSRRSIRRLLGVTTAATMVAADGGGLAGYAMIGFRRTSRLGRVFSLAVLPDRARRGLGAALLAACESVAWRRDCTAVRLEVRADNAPAIRLYERAGYVCFGRLESYYEDAGTALRFQKARPAAGSPPDRRP